MYVPLITKIYTHTLYCTCVHTLYEREGEVGRKERKRVASKEGGQGRRDLKSK